MGPAFYVMAILGCGEAETACEQVAQTPARYQSVDACNAATEASLSRHADAEFPVVVAQCRRSDQQFSDKLLPAQIDLPEAQRAPVLRASFTPAKRSRS